MPHSFEAKQVQSRNDPALYYEDDFINGMLARGAREAAIIVSSWSSQALRYPQSMNIGARQARDLPHHLLYAQKLNTKGIKLTIYYLSFNNAIHFNQKDKRSLDTVISKSYRDYILSFGSGPFYEDQFQAIYLNPCYHEKDGDLVLADMPDVSPDERMKLIFKGENAVQLRALKEKIEEHKAQRHPVLGMTAHSGGAEIERFARYFGVSIIGSCEANVTLGTKDGNKKLFALARVPYAFGSTKAQKDFGALLDDCYKVAQKTKCKKLIIKHNSSSAGKGNLDVKIEDCYNTDGSAKFDEIRKTVWEAITKYKHPERDKDIKEGVENFYMKKIRELGAIVEEKFEGSEVVSPATFAVVKRDGSVVFEYVYDQLLSGESGQNFGGSLGPTEVSDEHIEEIKRYTNMIGEAYAREGGIGYYGVDFLRLKVKNKDTGKEEVKLYVIEANLRKTGTRYPYIMAKHVLGDSVLRRKSLFHDDCILLPLGFSDMTGRRDEVNLFMDSFFRWIKDQGISYNSRTQKGAIVTFETHTAGKIGVLSIADSREEAKNIRKRFEEFFKHFSKTLYPREHLALHPSALERSRGAAPVAARFLEHKDIHQVCGRGLIATPACKREHRNPLSTLFSRLEAFTDRTMTRTVLSGGAAASSVRGVTRSSVSRPDTSLVFEADVRRIVAGIQSESQAHPFIPHEDFLKRRAQVRNPVFAVVGRSRTCDCLLIEAAKLNVTAYRLTENSDFTFDENTRTGYIKKVTAPKIDERTGLWKVVSDDKTEYDLPTVVYDYDFSATRRLVYHSRGEHIVLDKMSTVNDFLEKCGVVFFNGEAPSDPGISRLSPLRSQLAFAHALKIHEPELFRIYPDTIPLIHLTRDHAELMKFVDESSSFFIKPVLSERRPDVYLGNIFVQKLQEASGAVLCFQYVSSDTIEERKTLVPKAYKTPLKGINPQHLLLMVDRIKAEMGYSHDVSFLLQRSLETVDVRDQWGHSLASKIRIITQRDSRSREPRSTSLYGLYGGANAHLAYVGDPKIIIQNYLRSWGGRESEASIYHYIFQVAVRTHRAMEVATQGRLGECITDILLCRNGLVPIKTHGKPERPNFELIETQTHFGTYLEGSKAARLAFIETLKMNEATRRKKILEEVLRLHQEEFVPHEHARKNDVGRFVSVVPGVPIPEYVPAPYLKFS